VSEDVRHSWLSGARKMNTDSLSEISYQPVPKKAEKAQCMLLRLASGFSSSANAGVAAHSAKRKYGDKNSRAAVILRHR
jgi:diaminopimelate decarboxylase